MKIVLNSLPHLGSMITLVQPDYVTLKGDLQISGDKERTVGIVLGAVIE